MTACLGYLPALPPCRSHVEAPAVGLTPLPDSLICCGCRSCGGELGSAWVAGQHTGPPWLAPVILPSHSSARDINNNSTSGFTLLSRVNPFHCSTDCYCSGWPDPNPPFPPSSSPIPLAVSLHFSVSSTLSFFSSTENQLTWKNSPVFRWYIQTFCLLQI